MNINTLLFLSLFISFSSHGQKQVEAVFGEPTIFDKEFTSYPEDLEAAAVVLYEKGKVKVEVVNGQMKLITKVHVKMKVLDAKKFGDGATINIPFYYAKSGKERIEKLKAITHNGLVKTYLNSSQVYIKNEGGFYLSKSFTFPAVNDGSILEYTYQSSSPYFNSFTWELQGNYPKLYSEYMTEIPGNFDYRTALIGNGKLDYNDSKLKKNCFYINGRGDAADCVLSEFVMKKIPAFEEEDYMLSKENYAYKLMYELRQYKSVYGEKTNYTKTWKDVDKEFRNDKDMGRQLSYKSFFKGELPPSILNISEDLERAKAVYYFIQNHFIWNGDYRIYSDIRVKEAYNEKTGNIPEINLSLVNALRAANLEAQLTLSSTVNRKIPNQIYPVLTEFNYVMALLEVHGEKIYLDATNKYTPFGILPRRALNVTARVMDFKEGSYWHPIEPHQKNVDYINAQLTLDENNVISGLVSESHIGYQGVTKRNDLSAQSKDSYLENKEAKLKLLKISEYTVQNKDNNQETLKENFQISLELEQIGSQLYFYPYFLLDGFDENPFKLKERDYPVDLSFPFNYTYVLSLDLGETYIAKELPINKVIKLPNNTGVCTVVYTTNGSKINLRFNLKLNQYNFAPEYYPALKEFFSKVVEVKTNEPILIVKT